MATKDLHATPFDEATITKLEIFEDYAEAWIPTFVMSGFETICIFDFFAGTGYDKNGVEGSPIRILRQVKQQIGNIFQKKIKIRIFFNEWEQNKKEQSKFELLQKACKDFLALNKDVERAIELNLFNEDFETLFPKMLATIKAFPCLVYLDQNGIKFLSDKYFLELEKAKQTDFLYFVSASYFWRFGESEEFKMHLDINMSLAKKDPYRFIHRHIIDQLRLKLPHTTRLKLYPFSLKKGKNIHGIIFGASHPRAVDKFLNITWKRNETNGEANFDIDEDGKKAQLDIFGSKKLTKLEEFEQIVRKKLLAKEVTNNFELLDLAYHHGHLPSHAADVIKNMKKNGEIKYEGRSPLVTYDNVYKNKIKLNYTI